MIWKLAEPRKKIHLSAEDNGVWLRSELSDVLTAVQNTKPLTRLGRLMPVLISQLMEMGLGAVENGSFKIPFQSFVDLESNDIDAFDSIVEWSPFAIEIKTTGTLGSHDFKYQVRFYWGRDPVHLERLGCFVKRGQKIFRLEKESFLLLEEIIKFNSMPPEERTNAQNALLKFSRIKGLSDSIGAEIDRYIQDQKVLIPSKVGLDMTVDEKGRITFVPKIEGASEAGVIKAFMGSEDIGDVFSLDESDGGRLRVLLSEPQKEVLRRMQKVRHLSGADKAKVLSNPYRIFDGVGDSVEIDLRKFGPRVTGIGDFPFVVQPFVSYSQTGIFDDPDIDTAKPKRTSIDVGIKCKYLDGSEEDIVFKSRDDLLRFYNDVKVAQQNGAGTTDLNGKTIIVDNDLLSGVEQLVEKVTKRGKDKEETKRNQKYLLIYTNVDQLEYLEDKNLGDLRGEGKFTLPGELNDDFSLKHHQKVGLNWLQTNYLLNRKGCLLADEMGLGKTLQVLMFLAWLIENGDISPDGSNKESKPWNPVLIVAPIMLLENETWQKDMQTFFKGEVRVFEPHITLHGSNLKKFRREGFAGRETELETSVLDLEKLRDYRVILTNYETITNYQYSFAMMKDAWSVVITDEAQEYKTPNTKISHALKSLSPRFRVACTGTPVETRLLDIWNIFDFLQPGNLLGSASEFARNYERPIIEDGSVSTIGKLREQLLFGRPNAFVLRRDKSKLEDLPAKHEHKVFCGMSPEQRDKHVDFVSRARSGGSENHPLSMIQHLMKLYQHPALLPKYEPFANNQLDEAIRRCPKLERTMEILDGIQRDKEKVLIFTRSLDMQQLLATTIAERFRIAVDIINGATARSVMHKNALNTRKGILERFRGSPGFNVLILSPDVAGIGLTIVEANHVVHYGRWWNPARESQATDRIYRIGQTKDVHVYYLIAKDPNSSFKSFDERLDALLERRKALASDFLAPMPGEDELGKELWKDIINEGQSTETGKPLTREEIKALPWDRFEALIALVEGKKGYNVVLTPRSGDYGIDVISKEGCQVFLIQCKHTIWDSNIDADVVSEMLHAFDTYRGKWLRDMGATVLLKPILVTNGKCTNSLIGQAMMHDMDIVSGDKLWHLIRENPCTLAEVEMMENHRKTNMKEVQAELYKILGV